MITGPSWTRRYGSATPRLCARAGCGAPAAATLRFQPTRREAWLVDLDEAAPRTEGDLCTRHATTLVLPRGWALYDDRGVDVDIDPATDPSPRPVATAELAEPVEEPTESDDLVASVDARTPLLRRAFENVTSAGPPASPHIRPTVADTWRRADGLR